MPHERFRLLQETGRLGHHQRAWRIPRAITEVEYSRHLVDQCRVELASLQMPCHVVHREAGADQVQLVTEIACECLMHTIIERCISRRPE